MDVALLTVDTLEATAIATALMSPPRGGEKAALLPVTADPAAEAVALLFSAEIFCSAASNSKAAFAFAAFETWAMAMLSGVLLRGRIGIVAALSSTGLIFFTGLEAADIFALALGGGCSKAAADWPVCLEEEVVATLSLLISAAFRFALGACTRESGW